MKKKLFYVFAVLVLISIGVYYQNSEEILATSPSLINPVGICMAANTILCENGCRGSSGLTPLPDDDSFPSKCSPYQQPPYSIETCIECCLEELCSDLDAPEMDTPSISGLDNTVILNFFTSVSCLECPWRDPLLWGTCIHRESPPKISGWPLSPPLVPPDRKIEIGDVIENLETSHNALINFCGRFGRLGLDIYEATRGDGWEIKEVKRLGDDGIYVEIEFKF